MVIKGITQRWAINILGVIIIVLCIIAVFFSITIKQYYYESVRRELFSPAGSAAMYFSNETDLSEKSFEINAREFMDSFPYKSLMEVWVISKSGTPYITSTGFAPDENISMPDYEKALSTEKGEGEWIGRLPSGERVMAVTKIVYLSSGTRICAVRYMASLEQVDSQIANFIIFICLVCVLIVVMVIISSLYFIKSIVNPVSAITVTAKLIAQGDFNARINKHYDDEIGELCDTINEMAVELGNSDQMKNDFISTISHELRTPLTAIQGWGETLKDIGSTDEELFDKGLDVISHEAKRLTGMVEELLDFSRIQSGRMTLRKEKIDVLAELDEAVFVFRERANREGIELFYSIPELPAPAYADANRIKQVFVNVLDNAFKYNKKNGKVDISAQLLDGKIEIRIADTGCGIKEEDLPLVVEKFYKANKSVRGAGIGLAVTSEIINMHEGSLTIESIYGQSTTIIIRLPALVTPVEEVQLIAEMERSKSDESEKSE